MEDEVQEEEDEKDVDDDEKEEDEEDDDDDEEEEEETRTDLWSCVRAMAMRGKKQVVQVFWLKSMHQ